MHNFYEQHCSRWGVWGSKYLTSKFFDQIVDNKKNILLFSASKNDANDIFAMSMCVKNKNNLWGRYWGCLLYTSPSPRDDQTSRMPSSA